MAARPTLSQGRGSVQTSHMAGPVHHMLPLLLAIAALLSHPCAGAPPPAARPRVEQVATEPRVYRFSDFLTADEARVLGSSARRLLPGPCAGEHRCSISMEHVLHSNTSNASVINKTSKSVDQERTSIQNTQCDENRLAF